MNYASPEIERSGKLQMKDEKQKSYERAKFAFLEVVTLQAATCCVHILEKKKVGLHYSVLREWRGEARGNLQNRVI